jgi:hypothetical protein|tara:strand:- start:617 stop:832 length:216 start_codon:yes stop_codon:yes gene_type:complete
MKGFLATVIIEGDLFMVEFFKSLRIGVHWNNEMLGNASVLILGIYKFEINIALVYRKKLEWHDFGKEAGQS